jgi:uncharacterized protein YcbK (DUF882 family)
MITAKYFKESEFKKCVPACSLQDMQQGTMDKLDAAREAAGIPFVLNSAYRSVAHEKKQGRNGTSSHTKGMAVDIRCNSNENRMKIVRALLEAGFVRIGIGKTYVHADDDPAKSQNVMWHYY